MEKRAADIVVVGIVIFTILFLGFIANIITFVAKNLWSSTILKYCIKQIVVLGIYVILVILTKKFPRKFSYFYAPIMMLLQLVFLI